jgi:hypothetical protein
VGAIKGIPQKDVLCSPLPGVLLSP